MSHFNIDYNTRHLVTGDILPSPSSLLRVYNMRLCPFAQRTILALNAKEIEYEVVNVDLMNKPEWLFDKNPNGLVPVIELPSGIIYESLLTVEYIDEAYPQKPKLLSESPLTRVREKMLVKSAEPMETLYIKLVKFPDQVTDQAVAAYHKFLESLELILKSHNTKFFGGVFGDDQPSYVDLMIWPWFERYLTFDHDHRVRIDEIKYEKLSEYITNMLATPIVQSYLTPIESLKRLHEEFPQGTFDVNIVTCSK